MYRAQWWYRSGSRPEQSVGCRGDVCVSFALTMQREAKLFVNCESLGITSLFPGAALPLGQSAAALLGAVSEGKKLDGGVQDKDFSVPSWHLDLNSLSTWKRDRNVAPCLSLSLCHFALAGGWVCLSLTVDGVEARVRHASISGETVQLLQITLFKPCQLLIHLPSKLCIRWAELVCATIFSLLTPRRVSELQKSPEICAKISGQDPFDFSTSSLMATPWPRVPALRRPSSDWHPFRLAVCRTHLVSSSCLLATPAVSMAQEASLNLRSAWLYPLFILTLSPTALVCDPGSLVVGSFLHVFLSIQSYVLIKISLATY